MPFDPKERDLGLVYDGPVAVTEAYTIGLDEVVIQATPGAADYDIKLPPVAEAFGREYAITSMGNAVGTISVVGGGDEAATFAPAALTTTNDRIIVKSDGTNWNVVSIVAT